MLRQFSGVLTYVTECQDCHFKSERDSQFFELEINLKVNPFLPDCHFVRSCPTENWFVQPNCSLEKRLEALLTPEDLNGDNQ